MSLPLEIRIAKLEKALRCFLENADDSGNIRVDAEDLAYAVRVYHERSPSSMKTMSDPDEPYTDALQLYKPHGKNERPVRVVEHRWHKPFHRRFEDTVRDVQLKVGLTVLGLTLGFGVLFMLAIAVLAAVRAMYDAVT